MSIYILIAFILGFIVAQLSKLVTALVRQKGKLSKDEALAWLVRSGGMPSGHAASFVAATTMIGFLKGFDSAIFALAVCTTIIIMYDAMNVRYAVGEQGKVLNKFILSKKKKLRVVEGHTMPEVLVGIIIGVVCGLVVNLFR